MGIYSKKTITQKDTCNPNFIAMLFPIARTWKPPRRPLTDEWIKMWHIPTMEYYPATKRNEIESVLVIWMNLEPFIQSEVSQKEGNNFSFKIFW